MQADLLGRVRNTRLSYRHGLMPLFEAVANSIAAIEEAGRGPGEINISIKRNRQLDTLDVHGNTIDNIVSFEIQDNGVGFTPENFESFETMDSRAKERRGGKGIGRLLWLKAFDHATVESIYRSAGGWRRRSFRFCTSDDGIEDHLDGEVSESEQVESPRTTVRLVGFQDRYREAVPKSADIIARRLIEHCMQYFLLGEPPTMVVSDTACDPIDLAYLFKEAYRPESNTRDFEVGPLRLSLTDVLLHLGGDIHHRVHLCAHNRVVESIQLAGKIPYLDGSLPIGEGEEVMYAGFVRGEFLDDRVNAERTSFNIDREEHLGLDGGPNWTELISAVVHAVSGYLEPLTAGVRQQNMARIRSFVETDEPKYRPLLKARGDAVERIPPNLSDASLDLELHRLMSDWRHDLKRDTSVRLDEADRDASDFETHREEYQRLLGELQEVAKADLAGYVIHRATVLSFFEKLLGRQENGAFPREDALHGLFFPQRTTSDDVGYDDHSLWLIDERLAYHRFLASDVAFNTQASPVSVEGRDRPDILIYNQPLAFAPGEAPFESVVIVEFKRPERDDYDAASSPIRQVLSYVRQIRNGSARRPDGSTVEPVAATMSFFCHVIATLTPNLRTEALELGYTPSPGGGGYFFYNAQLNTYIEISSYRKVLADAIKRNRAFFDRLQIPGPRLGL